MSKREPTTPVHRLKRDEEDSNRSSFRKNIPTQPLTPFQSFKPHKTSALHHVTSFHTPDMSPISPSAIAPSNEYIHPSSTSTSRRNSRTGGFAMSPTLYYGPSSSVSSLGLESGFSLKNLKSNSNNNPHHDKYRTSSSSSSDDDDELIAAAYDSDDRMSLSSRRPSTSSIKGNLEEFTGIATTITTTTSSATTTTVPTAPTAVVKQMITNGRSLKPKMKSFLRITKDLQEEMAPLDYEIRREAELTSTFRDEDRRHAVTPFNNITEEEPIPHSSSSSSSLSPSNFHHQDLIARLEKFIPKDSAIISDTDDSDAATPTFPAITPSIKRKVTFLDDSPVTNLKRRAVSPGISSPSSKGSPTASHITRRASIKQVYDTSDGFQNLHLI